jgi:hypothetical protein
MCCIVLLQRPKTQRILNPLVNMLATPIWMFSYRFIRCCRGDPVVVIVRSPSSRGSLSCPSFCPSCCWGCSFPFHFSPGRAKCDASHPTCAFLHLDNRIYYVWIVSCSQGVLNWMCAGCRVPQGRRQHTYTTRFSLLEKETIFHVTVTWWMMS